MRRYAMKSILLPYIKPSIAQSRKYTFEADKTNNFYGMRPEAYEIALLNNITKT